MPTVAAEPRRTLIADLLGAAVPPAKEAMIAARNRIDAKVIDHASHGIIGFRLTSAGSGASTSCPAHRGKSCRTRRSAASSTGIGGIGYVVSERAIKTAPPFERSAGALELSEVEHRTRVHRLDQGFHIVDAASATLGALARGFGALGTMDHVSGANR